MASPIQPAHWTWLSVFRVRGRGAGGQRGQVAIAGPWNLAFCSQRVSALDPHGEGTFGFRKVPVSHVQLVASWSLAPVGLSGGQTLVLGAAGGRISLLCTCQAL